MTENQADTPQNTHAGARSGFNPAEPPDEGTATRDGTVDDVRPLGVSENPDLDQAPEEDSDDASGTTDGVQGEDPADQETEGTDDGTVEGVYVDSDTAGTGESVNVETGEVTQPGDPLPPIQQEDGEPIPPQDSDDENSGG